MAVPVELRRAADLLERRLVLSVIYASKNGATRFVEFATALSNPPPATLSARLSDLVEGGLLERACDGRRVEYRLTRAGRELATLLEGLLVWSRRA